MSMTAEQRADRARNAIDARWHPGVPREQLDTERIDRAATVIEQIVARAGKPTPEQAARLGRLFTYIDPDAG